MPKTVGKGSILLSPGRINLANQCWLIDDECVQFDSTDGHMYVYNLNTKTCKNYNLENLDRSDIDWLNEMGNFSNKVHEKAMKIIKNPTSETEIVFGQSYQTFFSYLYCQDKNNDISDDLLGNCIGFFAHYYDIYYNNGQLVHQQNNISWSDLGREIVKKLNVEY